MALSEDGTDDPIGICASYTLSHIEIKRNMLPKPTKKLYRPPS
jgi:hypothetical protein